MATSRSIPLLGDNGIEVGGYDNAWREQMSSTFGRWPAWKPKICGSMNHEDDNSWTCTLIKGHGDYHVARTLDGKVCARWGYTEDLKVPQGL